MREEIDPTTHITGIAKFLLDGWSMSSKKVEEEVFQEAKFCGWIQGYFCTMSFKINSN